MHTCWTSQTMQAILKFDFVFESTEKAKIFACFVVEVTDNNPSENFGPLNRKCLLLRIDTYGDSENFPVALVKNVSWQ